MRVLISGASIAGTAAAYWFDRYGCDVTVVERAPALRPGGQAIDVRGPALDVAARMGVLDDLRRLRTGLHGMSVAAPDGTELMRTTERTASGGPVDSPDVEILRDDLANVLAEAGGDGIEYLFDDSIAALEQDEDEVRVVFLGGDTGTFDLVVGADGLHSTTRRLVFGPEEDYLSHLGACLAVWTAPNVLGLHRWQQIYLVEDNTWGAMAMSVRDDTELRVYMGFETADRPVTVDWRDVPAQKRLLAERFAGAGGGAATLLETLPDAADFHCDELAQIHLDAWSRGRVVLLGDAGYCGSPASGQGTSMAMVGAYVLAGELKAAGGDHEKAFTAYEDELRDFVRANQDIALVNMATMQRRAEADEPSIWAEPDDSGRVENAYTLRDY